MTMNMGAGSPVAARSISRALHRAKLALAGRVPGAGVGRHVCADPLPGGAIGMHCQVGQQLRRALHSPPASSESPAVIRRGPGTLIATGALAVGVLAGALGPSGKASAPAPARRPGLPS